MAHETALAGIRVVECCGWNGVFAGRILADGGAEVVRVVPPAGDPLDSEPPFFGDTAISIQAAWYNAGKRVVTIDTSTGAGRGQLLELVAGADILLEDWTPGREPLSVAELAAAQPALVRVSISPVGRDAVAPLVTNDLVANALSGAASVTGTPDTPPLTGYGNQTYHTAGMYAAICALASLRVAQATGCGQHVDLSAHEALISCTEQVLMQWFLPWTWPSRIAPRQGSLHWSGAYAVYPGRTGQGVMITPAMLLMDEILPWLEQDGMDQGLADRERFPDLLALLPELPTVMRVLREWTATKDPMELFFEAQAKHLSWGPVLSIPEVVESPQIEARGYLKPATVPGFGEVPFPGRLFQTDHDGPHPAPPARVTVRDLGWARREPVRAQPDRLPPGKPLAGVRVLDFTHVLAGPFGTRVLGDLGADIIKAGTAERAAGANTPAHPYYVCWNRNKRSISLNMRSEAGRALARRVAEHSDVVIENFSASVLKRWGMDREALAQANPRVSVISMGGMGQTGPWRSFVSFAPTIHALTGLTYLTNPPGEHLIGYGFSLTDHLSGLAGAIAALEAIQFSRRTGSGLAIDLSQYEVGLGLMGPALLDRLANGTAPEPVGNRHPFAAWAPHGIYRAQGDDRWAAIAVRWGCAMAHALRRDGPGRACR
ncbi:MAG: CoA transferase [Chloroflexi bacterium]|nr:CoA transferase [Chloroflexota bacterium]